MIDKKYLFDNKDANDYVSVCIDIPDSLGLSSIYEAVFAVLDPDVNRDEVFVIDYQIKEGMLEVSLDVEDVDFSEFED